jgi:hypothetical protein
MQSGLFRRGEHRLLVGLVLVALVLRALIPTGFMPAGDGTFGLIVCPDGFQAQPLAHHGHHHDHDHQHQNSGQSAHFEHCPYGGLASAPIPHSAVMAGIVHVDGDPPPTLKPSPAGIKLVHLPQPRGPPRLG